MRPLLRAWVFPIEWDDSLYWAKRRHAPCMLPHCRFAAAISQHPMPSTTLLSLMGIVISPVLGNLMPPENRSSCRLR